MRIEPYGQPLSGLYPNANKPSTTPFELPADPQAANIAHATENAAKLDAHEKLRLLLEEKRIENHAATSEQVSPPELGQLIDLRV
jgi:hypothetical protein